MDHRNLSPELGGGGERNGKKERDDGREGAAPNRAKKNGKKNVKNAILGRRDGHRIDF